MTTFRNEENGPTTKTNRQFTGSGKRRIVVNAKTLVVCMAVGLVTLRHYELATTMAGNANGGAISRLTATANTYYYGETEGYGDEKDREIQDLKRHLVELELKLEDNNAKNQVDRKLQQEHGDHDDTTDNNRLLFSLPLVPDVTVESTLKDIIPTVDYNHTTAHCPPTSQFQFFSPSSDNNMTLRLQTLDQNGNPKTVGGDEMTILYMDHKDMNPDSKIPRDVAETPTAVALVHDLQNGVYDLEFVRSPLPSKKNRDLNNYWETGTLYVYYHYTCGVGRLLAPEKDHWPKGGGLLNQVYHQTNVTAPPIRPYQRPPQVVDLGAYKTVICMGDSLIRNLCGSYKKEGKMPDKFYKPNIKLTENVGQWLTNTSALDRAMQELATTYPQELEPDQQENTVILIGAFAWDLHAHLDGSPGHYLNKLLDRNAKIIDLLRRRYPKVTVVWKGPNAVQPYVLEHDVCFKKPACRHRVRYMSHSTTKYAHERQQQLMKQLGVPYMDLYETTQLSPTWGLRGDAIHYRMWMNLFLLDLFYPPHLQFQEKCNGGRMCLHVK